ncbi:MAG: pyruvate:ferredoxin (flavodoxin) oxidoreductase, partial [Clostridia bacterium]|nr:pyruvate:ferredoxin (flavodoxin) oxidoreductase [Clostridia bacterium]
KPLALMTMQYQTAYVAQVCLGANMQQLVKALTEAEAFDGPSLIIAYTPCIAHGVSMSKSIEEERLAVDCGYWHLFRYDPRLIAEGKNPFQLDSKAPTKPIREFLDSENRFASLKKSNPQAAEALFKQAEQESKTLFSVYKRLAEAENKS